MPEQIPARRRIVSWLPAIPSAAAISSAIRGLGGIRKYRQTAEKIASAGKRRR